MIQVEGGRASLRRFDAARGAVEEKPPFLRIGAQAVRCPLVGGGPARRVAGDSHEILTLRAWRVVGVAALPRLAAVESTWPRAGLPPPPTERLAKLEPIFCEEGHLAADFAAQLEEADPRAGFNRLAKKYRAALATPYSEDRRAALVDRATARGNLSELQSDKNVEVLSWVEPSATATVRSGVTFANRGYFWRCADDLTGTGAGAWLVMLKHLTRGLGTAS